MRSRTITYHNEGVPLAATLYLPDEIERGRRLPGVILLTGYIATQKIALPDVAAYYTKRGYAALAVDYRGFGKSGGPRWRLMCDERIRDTRMAITWFEGQSEVDPDRVGIYGSSFGGSIAVAVAAIDRRARAIVCLGSPSDGESWMASQRSLSEWMAFRRRVDEDTKRRCAGGESEWLDHYREFVPLDVVGIPNSEAVEIAGAGHSPQVDSSPLFTKVLRQFLERGLVGGSATSVPESGMQ